MVAPLARFSDRLSRSPLKLVGALALMLLIFAGMILADAAIERQSGFPTFDSPGVEWTRETMAEALFGYGTQAHVLHWVFTILDTAFPLLLALVAAALTGLGLRLLAPVAYEKRQLYRILPVFYIVTLLDWVENIAKQWLVSNYPPLSETAANVFVLFNGAKSSAGMVMILAPLCLLAGLAAVLYRKVRSREP